MLTDKLMTAEQKAEGYDDLEAQNSALKTKLASAEQTIKDNQKDAEIERERALNVLEKEKDKEIAGMRETIANLKKTEPAKNKKNNNK